MKFFIAKLISFVFHPVVLAVIIPFIVTYHSTTNISYGVKWSLFSLLFIFLVLGVLFLARPKEFFSDFDISQREKRPLFYTISIIFAVIYFTFAVYLKGIYFPLSLVALGIIIGLVIFDIANMYIKVSIHAAISSAFIITYGLLYGPVAFVATFWIPFAVSWSRLLLKKHTKTEVTTGALLGCILTLMTFAIAELML